MTFKAGFLGLIGLPNAGKSTLLNALVEEKLSIVTAKPQTTRRRILGVVNADQAQIVVVDAPGLVKAPKGLNAFLEKEADEVISNSDALCAVLNLDEDKKENLDSVIEKVKSSGRPWMVVITKVDLVQLRHRLERLKKELNELKPDLVLLEFSSTWGQDLKDFRAQFARTASSMLPNSQGPLYDPEILTPQPVRDWVAEIVREKCFENLHFEIPYQLAVRIREFDESRPKITHVHAEILVSKDGHRPIVLGRQAQLLKKIGMESRKEIEKFIQKKVFLGLEVVVRESWEQNPRLMKELGYVVD